MTTTGFDFWPITVLQPHGALLAYTASIDRWGRHRKAGAWPLKTQWPACLLPSIRPFNCQGVLLRRYKRFLAYCCSEDAASNWLLATALIHAGIKK